jgi:hypothetical protein
MNDLEGSISILIFLAAFIACLPIAFFVLFVSSTILKFCGKLKTWWLPILSGLAMLASAALACRIFFF